ncbi:MAG: helix-turn-helix transcriptional regulator [Lachnospiraceae bacterium]|nr:helix-turn-helix transcriptional regulator [Lachnospiraceae bacterium]
MLISEKIFVILKEKKMTQKEFSEKTGIPQSTISDWKGKKVNPAADKIMDICKVLNMSADELLSDGETDYIMIDKQTQEYRIIEEFRNRNNS